MSKGVTSLPQLSGSVSPPPYVATPEDYEAIKKIIEEYLKRKKPK